MSAFPPAPLVLRPMRPGDLEAVVRLEAALHSHPWSLGNFRDSLHAGYSCWMLEHERETIGYGVMMMGVGEVHLLNLSVAPGWQRQGLGRGMLEHLLEQALDCGAREMLLEVRPSNLPARALYAGMGFREVALRRGYYPAADGREDAILMARACGAAGNVAAAGAE